MKHIILLVSAVFSLVSCTKDGSQASLLGRWDLESIHISQRERVELLTLDVKTEKETGNWTSISCSGSIIFKDSGNATFVSQDGTETNIMYHYDEQEQYIDFYQVANFSAVFDFKGGPNTINIGPVAARNNDPIYSFRVSIQGSSMTLNGRFYTRITDRAWWQYDNAAATFTKK